MIKHGYLLARQHRKVKYSYKQHKIFIFAYLSVIFEIMHTLVLFKAPYLQRTLMKINGKKNLWKCLFDKEYPQNYYLNMFDMSCF